MGNLKEETIDSRRHALEAYLIALLDQVSSGVVAPCTSMRSQHLIGKSRSVASVERLLNQRTIIQ